MGGDPAGAAMRALPRLARVTSKWVASESCNPTQTHSLHPLRGLTLRLSDRPRFCGPSAGRRG